MSDSSIHPEAGLEDTKTSWRRWRPSPPTILFVKPSLIWKGKRVVRLQAIPPQYSQYLPRICWNIFLAAFCFTITWSLLNYYLIFYTPTWFCLPASKILFLSEGSCGPPPWWDAHIVPPSSHANNSNSKSEVPQYVFDYAPLVHLFSGETFWPCDMVEHLNHTTPELTYDPIESLQGTLNLTNLDQLNDYDNGVHVYLTSDDNVEDRPAWLLGESNIPSDFSYKSSPTFPLSSILRNRSPKAVKTKGGDSDAPAVMLTVDKGNGILDAFWFFFYSYNLGNKVFNIRFGNHVGDWEHTMVRFQHGEPKAVFFSEHNFGSAYSYDAVEKIGKRVCPPISLDSCIRFSGSLTTPSLYQPIIYSATGTHAMYATPGLQPYILPLGLLHDQTDRGPLWDPSLNLHSYTYNHHTDILRPSNYTPSSPTQWFYFNGHWGDKAYPLSDSRQYGVLGEYHYVTGPLGPRFKHLGRRKVCQGLYDDPCDIKHRLGELVVGGLDDMPKGLPEGWDEMMDGIAERNREGGKSDVLVNGAVEEGPIEAGSERRVAERIDLR